MKREGSNSTMRRFGCCNTIAELCFAPIAFLALEKMTKLWATTLHNRTCRGSPPPPQKAAPPIPNPHQPLPYTSKKVRITDARGEGGSESV